jgi:hypothetical protein
MSPRLTSIVSIVSVLTATAAACSGRDSLGSDASSGHVSGPTELGGAANRRMPAIQAHVYCWQDSICQRGESTNPTDNVHDTGGQRRGYQRTTSRVPANNVEGASEQRRGCQRTTSRVPANNVGDVSTAIHGSQRCRSILLAADLHQTSEPDRVAIATRSTNVVMSNVDVAPLNIEDRSSPLAGRPIESRAGGCKYGRARSSRLNCRSSR